MRENNKKYQLYLMNVCKNYGDKLVLNQLNLRVAAGELCAIVGPSGCGKSTLLRIILGQEKPSLGDILLDGNIIDGPNIERGVVYQKYSLFPHLSVLDNILLGKRLFYGFLESKRRKKEFKEEAYFYLNKVKLSEHAYKFPHELSGGMQQRAAIAQALIMKPKILLMDEPFGALDPSTRESIQVFLLQLWEEFKMTIFFVTHDLEEAVYLGTRIIVLSSFYCDNKNGENGAGIGRGAKIIADYALERIATSTVSKTSEYARRLIQSIRRTGFDPDNLQYINQFNLCHPDSFNGIEI